MINKTKNKEIVKVSRKGIINYRVDYTGFKQEELLGYAMLTEVVHEIDEVRNYEKLELRILDLIGEIERKGNKISLNVKLKYGVSNRVDLSDKLKSEYAKIHPKIKEAISKALSTEAKSLLEEALG